MNILVHDKNGETTQALRSFIKTQIKKLGKLGVSIRQVRVFLENISRRDSDPNRASVIVDVDIDGKRKASVKSKAHDLYKAVSDVSQDVIRQVRKKKEKDLSKLRKRQRALIREREE